MLEIWAEDNIQRQLDKTHKKIFGKNVTVGSWQPQDNSIMSGQGEKVRLQYLRMQDAVCKSCSSMKVSKEVSVLRPS